VTIPRVLIIAGSDSGGGAGIQADIKTVTMLGGHAMTAITAITAQNTLGVQQVMPVPAEMVIAQIESVVSDIGVDAIKIGMLGSPETANAVADYLSSPSFRSLSSSPRKRGFTTQPESHEQAPEIGPRFRGGDDHIAIVFDPVMISTSGSTLADAATIAAFGRLMRLATIVTPNVPELTALIGRNCDSELEGRIAAEDLANDFECAVLAKGGHRDPAHTDQTMALPSGEMTTTLLSDWLIVPPGQWHGWSDPKIETRHTHGTGCTLSSAIAVGLASGLTLPNAVMRARGFVRAALLAAPGLGSGAGPMGHALGVTPFDAVSG
jgi:hydroxymethylpyrimidine/phosphomethylpyrimidine kinase